MKLNYQVAVAFLHTRKIEMVQAGYWGKKDPLGQIHRSANVQLLYLNKYDSIHYNA